MRLLVRSIPLLLLAVYLCPACASPGPDAGVGGTQRGRTADVTRLAGASPAPKGPAVADEVPDEADPPKADDGTGPAKPGEPQGDGPKGDEPKADDGTGPAKPEEPQGDGPKGDEPKGDDGTGPAKPEEPKGDEPKGDAPKDGEPKDGEPKDGAAANPDPKDGGSTTAAAAAPKTERKVTELLESPTGVKAPAGMIYVPAGRAVIGTPPADLAKLLNNRNPEVFALFQFESPQYQVDMPGFFADQYEVTNAQYVKFLKEVATAEHKTTGDLANLDEVCAHLLGMALADVSKSDAVYTWLLFLANTDELTTKLPNLVVKLPGKDEVDLKGTFKKMRRAPLPPDIQFKFYDRVPPQDWQGLEPKEEILDLPVRWVSYIDAAAYAEWAGKHVLTEPEWEYVARGPQGYVYPWGNTWFADESHAVWGGIIVDSHFQPCPIPVDGNPPAFSKKWREAVPPYDGMSWCGAYHMLGNVWEWTSSWFDRYPGATRDHPWMGAYVKVLRGASFEDVDPLALRLSARNWSGTGTKNPPRPENSFENVGFRCGWYANPGQDRLEGIIARASRGRQVQREDVALDRWGGATAVHLAGQGANVEHHVYVGGASHALVLIPKKSLLPPGAKKPKIKTRKNLLDESDNDEDPFTLGMFHTDVPLANVWVRDREAALKEKEKEEKRGGRRRTKPEAPPTMKGTVEPGTYLVGFWYGRLCLMLPSLDFVGFLSQSTIQSGQMEVKHAKDGVPGVTIEVTSVADTFELAFAVPVGGEPSKGDDDLTVFIQKITVEAKAGALELAGEWHTGHAGPVAQVVKPAPDDKNDKNGKKAGEGATKDAGDAKKGTGESKKGPGDGK